jgi:hypothetical protein
MQQIGRQSEAMRAKVMRENAMIILVIVVSVFLEIVGTILMSLRLKPSLQTGKSNQGLTGG